MDGYELVDRLGQRLNLYTQDTCVEMQGGGTLADYANPGYLLVEIQHNLNIWPFPVVWRWMQDGRMVHIPVRAECPDRDTLKLYTVQPLAQSGGKPELKKIQDREYSLAFAEGQTLYIRLI